MPEEAQAWGRIASEPVFVLTSDQDWAPEWAITRFLDRVSKWKQPLHLFRTNESPGLDQAVADGTAEQGWHPNFMPGSSHGSTVDEVVEYCQKTFPGARTARAHCFAEDSFRMRALAKAGIIADSQNPTPCLGYLMPMVHPAGILRLPVYFEDDVAFGTADATLTVDVFRKSLFTPGLKILNFHPTFVACNTPSQAHYDSVRARIFGTQELADGVVWSGHGTADMFDALLSEILSAGFVFQSLHSVVDELWQRAREAPGLLPQGALLQLNP